jgi:hypothetical protein
MDTGKVERGGQEEKRKKRGEEEYNGKRKNRETMRIWFFFPGL